MMNRHEARAWIVVTSFLLAAVGRAAPQEKPVETPRPPAESVAAATVTATTSLADPYAATLSVTVAPVPEVRVAVPVVAKQHVARAIGVAVPGPGSGGNRARPASIYVLVACAHAEDPSDKCREGIAQATEALTDSMAEEAAASASRRMIKVRFTAFLNRAEQLKALKDVETSAISTMEFMLNEQLKAAMPFSQPLPLAVALAAIREDERALDKINTEARREAVAGSNWNHEWSSSTHTYTSNVYNEPESWELSPALKHEFECAGAGNKPGCSWDGRNGQTLYTK